MALLSEQKLKTPLTYSEIRDYELSLENTLLLKNAQIGSHTINLSTQNTIRSNRISIQFRNTYTIYMKSKKT